MTANEADAASHPRIDVQISRKPAYICTPKAEIWDVARVKRKGTAGDTQQVILAAGGQTVVNLA